MKHKISNFILVFVLAVVMLFLQYFGAFQNLEFQLQDVHYQKGGLVSPEIYVIGIDEETLMKYGPWQNWGREKMAEIITLLNEDETMAPAVIGLDIGFFGESNPEDDQALADAAALLDNVVATSYATFGKQIEEHEDGTFSTVEGVQTYELPYEAFRKHISWGFSNVPLDEDGIVRHSMYRVPVNGEMVYSFASEVYRKYMGELPYQAEFGNQTGYIPFTGYPYDYYGSETAGISFASVLSGEIPKEYFAGTIVLIGPYSAGMMDAYMTAIKHDTAMFGVEVHANIVQAFIDGIEKTSLTIEQSLLITFAMILIAMVSWYTGKLFIVISITSISVCGYWYLSSVMYERGYIFPLLYPIVSALSCFIVQVAFQYIRERKAKRQIQNVFGRYVSESVVSTIVKGGEEALKLGGQKKDIAVLFVDIRGFTPLSEGLEPEKVVEILNRYLEITTQEIFKQKGTVDKFMGDATMALFNAPLDLDDYVFRAVKCGLDMASSSTQMEEEIEVRTGTKVGFGIGINCGEVVIGNVGSSKRMEYTAIGSVVNTASRLEGIAKAGEVIISPEVYERLKGRIIADSLGKYQLKGITEPMEVYRVTGVIESD